ncbi:MAG: glycosyltransferase [Limnochordaceae bacterium]|nr:glycosyltransferase [Limnochordaceae bacterium]
MASEQMKLSLIIPTYNRRAVLQQVLMSLVDQQPTGTGQPVPEFEVIVVDDGSTDDTLAMLAQAVLPFPLRVIQARHTGPAHARNLGVAAAQAPLLLFLDSDLLAGPQLVAAHYEAHRVDPDDRIVHGPVIQVDTLDVTRARQVKARLGDLSRAFFATGNASLAKRHIEAAGGFDEEFSLYGWEDLEMGERLRRLGLKAVWVAEAQGYHYKPPLQTKDLPSRCRREEERAHNAILFYRKHPSRRVRWMIPLHPVTFGIERLISFGGWPERRWARHWLAHLEVHGPRWLWRFGSWAVIQHAYYQALRREWRHFRTQLPPGGQARKAEGAES